MSEIIIGVMGPGDGATDRDIKTAYALGKQIADNDWILLTGGRRQGVMHAASKGAREAGGTTIGILPSVDVKGMSEFIDIPIMTGMGDGRNYINILSSLVIIACGLGAGTSSEISLALKTGKQVILLNQNKTTLAYFHKMSPGLINEGPNVDSAIQLVRQLI